MLFSWEVSGTDYVTFAYLLAPCLTAFDFDDNGNLETLTTPRFDAHAFTSDGANRPETYTSPENVTPSQPEVFTYDNDGALDGSTDASPIIVVSGRRLCS